MNPEGLMRVCHCYSVTDHELRASVREGGGEVGGKARLAGTACGGCKPLVDAIVASERQALSTDGPGRLSGLAARVRDAVTGGSFLPVRGIAKDG